MARQYRPVDVVDVARSLLRGLRELGLVVAHLRVTVSAIGRDVALLADGVTLRPRVVASGAGLVAALRSLVAVVRDAVALVAELIAFVAGLVALPGDMVATAVRAVSPTPVLVGR